MPAGSTARPSAVKREQQEREQREQREQLVARVADPHQLTVAAPTSPPPGSWLLDALPSNAEKSPFDLGQNGPAASQAAQAASPSSHTHCLTQRQPQQSRLDPNVHNDRTRYFVITSNTKENVVKSVRHSLWATQRKNEQKLDDAFRTSSVVILVFSVNGSEAFQGYARMHSLIGRPSNLTVDPFHGFGRLFDLEWLRLHDLPFREVENMRNPLNEDKSVRAWRDGQELATSVGRKLCGLIDQHIDDPESFPSTGNGPPGSFNSNAQLAVKRASSSEERAKKRRKDKLWKNPPNPLNATYDEVVDFFLALDYEGYVEWVRRFGSMMPGPWALGTEQSPHLALPPMNGHSMAHPPPHIAWTPPSAAHSGPSTPQAWVPPPVAQPPPMMPPPGMPPVNLSILGGPPPMLSFLPHGHPISPHM